MFEVMEIWHSTIAEDSSSAVINLVVEDLDSSLFQQMYFYTHTLYNATSEEQWKNEFFEKRKKCQERMFFECLLANSPQHGEHNDSEIDWWLNDLKTAVLGFFA